MAADFQSGTQRMSQLLDLSNELVQYIASHLRQVDLLNVSLTCKYLRRVMGCELFREYQSPHAYDTFLISIFFLRVVQTPHLARYIKTLDLNKWHALEDRKSFDGSLDLEPTKEEHALLTAAAKEAGIINAIHVYERKSSVIAKREKARNLNTTFLQQQIFGAYPSFDQKFYLLLRAGVEDANVMLLLAILPNLTDISLLEARSCQTR
jgi:hypothetical protein